jgi:uncharacterized membrane protein
MKSTNNGQLFSVVTKFTGTEIEYFNIENRKIDLISIEEFKDLFLGSILAVEATKDSIEKDFKSHFKEEYQIKSLNFFIRSTLPIISILICVYVGFTNAARIIGPPILLTLINLIGCFITILLLWHEVDSLNPALKKICQTSKYVDCNAILNSKAAKIFGISWSSIGFIYFSGMLMALLIGGLTNVPILHLLAIINILALPYTLYSIYYQWRIAKQWCLLCLMVQVLLASQFFINIFSGYITTFNFNSSEVLIFLSVFSSFVFSAKVILIIIPALQKAKTGIQRSIELQQLKNNPLIFEALLVKERSVPLPLPEIGIVIGNPIGKFKLIKVCNPYCDPCASAHPIIESLLNNSDNLCVQIILPATENNIDIRKKPIRHLLAIDSLYDKKETLKALDDWYNAPIKDYSLFSKKYPIAEELNRQDGMIKLMLEWSKNVDIQHTPTFFLCLNAHISNPILYELPKMYDLRDLLYFLKNS